MRLIAATLGVSAFLISACAPSGSGELASDALLVSSSAAVEAVDAGTRTVTLRDQQDGSVFSVTAGPEVRNFAQIAPGDVVEVEFYESIVLEMADAQDTGEALVMAGAARAPEGERPAGEAIVSTSVVVEVISYDAMTGEAVFRLPDGTVGRSSVAPALRSFAAQRRPGDRVLVTITDAVALSMRPSDG
jgi:translation initiation factor IF-1